mgnify:CR=1 FL=1
MRGSEHRRNFISKTFLRERVLRLKSFDQDCFGPEQGYEVEIWLSLCRRNCTFPLHTFLHQVNHQSRPSLKGSQKWGVYSCPSLTELGSHNKDGSECQSPETTHFWQGRRLGQTNKIQINKWLRPQAAYVSLCKESNQHSSGAGCKMICKNILIIGLIR